MNQHKKYTLVRRYGIGPYQMKFGNASQEICLYDIFGLDLPVDPGNFEDYRQEAKALIDIASKTLSPVGIKKLLPALIDLISSEYCGNQNGSVYSEMSYDDIKKLIEDGHQAAP